METIRKAGPEDLDALIAISRETFTATFGHTYTPEDLAAFLDADYAPGKAATELADPEVRIWFLEVDDRIVGYAKAGPCKIDNPDVTLQCGELHRIYLIPEFQGGGRGARLFQVALDWLEAQGRHPVWIGVFSGNVGAQRFYERHGFAKVGEHTFRVGDQIDREFTLRRG